MLRPLTIIGSLLILSSAVTSQVLEGQFLELKLSVKSLDSAPAAMKGDPDTIAKGSYKSPKKGAYLEANADGDGGYDFDLWYSDDGVMFTEYTDAGSMSSVLNDLSKGEKRQYAEFVLNVTTAPAPAEGDAEGISFGGIVTVKINAEDGDVIPAVDAVQSLSGTATDGTFDLTFDGEIADDVDATTDAATLQTTLEGLANIGAGNVTVTGGPFPTDFVITFVGTLAGTDVAALVVSDDLSTAADIAAGVTTSGSPESVGPATVKSAQFKLQSQGAVSDSFDGDDIGTPKASLKFVPADKLPDGVGVGDK